jgi:hypothetical protein
MASSKPPKKKAVPIRPDADVLDKGLPSNVNTERFVLGAILVNSSLHTHVAASLVPADFSLEKHRRIFARMDELAERGERIDRETLANELQRYNELESCDGLSYLLSLDDGMPVVSDPSNVDPWVRIIRTKAVLRSTIFAAQKLTNECLLETAAPAEILAGHIAQIQELSQRGGGAGQAIADIPLIQNCGKTVVEYLREPELPRGAVVALTGDSGCGKSTLASAWGGDLVADGVPVLILDRENPLSAVAERLDRLSITDGPLFKYSGGWLEQGVPGPDSAAVIAWVKSCEPKPLVIVDSMAAFHGGDENDAGETRAFMQQCRTLADLGATVIVIHHEGKADTAKDYRGSSDFKAAVDAAFHVANSPGPDGRLGTIRLRCYKSRLGFAGELIYHYRDGRFERSLEHEPFKTDAEQLSAILRDNPGIEAVPLDKLCTAAKLGRDRCRKILKGWQERGEIKVLKGEKNRSRYYLAGDFPSPADGDLVW